VLHNFRKELHNSRLRIVTTDMHLIKERVTLVLTLFNA